MCHHGHHHHHDHPHPHDHDRRSGGDGHGHRTGGAKDVEHAAESFRSVGSGPPVLDIGGDVGALVVTLDHAALGQELFVRPFAEPAMTVHTGVWRREVGGESLAVAVFLELLAGSYHILDEEGRPVTVVEIDGGAVTNLDLRSARPADCPVGCGG